jgi:hypothetical protein
MLFTGSATAEEAPSLRQDSCSVAQRIVDNHTVVDNETVREDWGGKDVQSLLRTGTCRFPRGEVMLHAAGFTALSVLS